MGPKVELGTIFLIRHSFGLVMVAKPKRWRGGRVVECTGLENQHTFTGIGGSNPPPSANLLDVSFPSQHPNVNLLVPNFRKFFEKWAVMNLRAVATVLK